MASPAEREIRDAVVEFLHMEAPRARVIHELVCGGCRADLAAVEPERILLFEIKSERDVLDRLDQQMKTFSQAGHRAILVSHEKWFDTTPYNNGAPRLAWPHEHSWRFDIWCYPRPIGRAPLVYDWRLPRPELRQPRASTLLEMLWKEELLVEAERHRIIVRTRDRCPDIIDQMAWLMTGREIVQAVCRQLRSRHFPEADPALDERGSVLFTTVESANASAL